MITLDKKIVNSLPLYLQKRLPKKIKVVAIKDKESRRLNRVYRDKDKTANVLSFRYVPDYGEILVCPRVIRREAKEQGNTYRYQFAWMILHGMIHLAGMHHEGSKVLERRMTSLEEKVLAKLFGNNKQ